MAPKRKPLRNFPLPTPVPIGNCEVVVEARNFSSESTQNSLQITISKNVKVKVSVVDAAAKCENAADDIPGSGSEANGEYYFVLVNPKDSSDQTKSLIQEVLDMYSKELPAMKFAANTGKKSMFLERCVSNGKYCTLLLVCKSNDHLREVLSAITYQIVPADTHYAEIPLAAVKTKYQKKGIGRLLYMELSNRLQKVGIRTFLCWGDQESEGFWLKQGFVVIGEVSKKGRARRLPIKAEIRKALCFPGGSTLMVSHLNDSSPDPADQIKLLHPLKFPGKHHSSDIAQKLPPECMEETGHSEGGNQIISSSVNSQSETLATQRFLIDGCQDADSENLVEDNNTANKLEFEKSGEDFEVKKCSCSTPGPKKRTWEASLTSMNSKKIKGGHAVNCLSDPGNVNLSAECYSSASSFLHGYKLLVGGDALESGCLEKNSEECRAVNETSEDKDSCKLVSTDICFRVMLMNIADDNKKTNLTKIIQDLGGIVKSDGTVSSHVVTGKVRKTLNFCTALCSGAWIISPSWLKESYRSGRFVDEMPYLLKDTDYELKYKVELKAVVLRAKASPNSLLKGREICLAAHVQPPTCTLSAIIKSAGGNVISGLEKVKDPSKTIYIASEEDMEEALLAVRNGMKTFGSDWLMTCIMKQELDLEASQFAESL